MNTYLNLTSLHKHSITVAPPKEWPMTAILHKSIQFCKKKQTNIQSTISYCKYTDLSLIVRFFPPKALIFVGSGFFVITFNFDQSKSERRIFSTDVPKLMLIRRSKALMHSSALCFTCRKWMKPIYYLIKSVFCIFCVICSWLHEFFLIFSLVLNSCTIMFYAETRYNLSAIFSHIHIDGIKICFWQKMRYSLIYMVLIWHYILDTVY